VRAWTGSSARITRNESGLATHIGKLEKPAPEIIATLMFPKAENIHSPGKILRESLLGGRKRKT